MADESEHRELWPSEAPDGSVAVALHFVELDRAARGVLTDFLEAWLQEQRGERLVALDASLRRTPYISDRDATTADVVFEGRTRSTDWKDWLVLFTKDVQEAHPELRVERFWDLVGDRPRNPFSVQ